MGVKYHKHAAAGTPQTEQARPDQVKNSGGGFVFQITPWQRLDRFLLLGAEGGTYYVSEQKLSKDNAKNIIELIKTDGVKVVEHLTETSRSGRAYKQDPLIFALALCSAYGDVDTKRAVQEHFNEIIRTGTHLFTYVEFAASLRGWGRHLKKVVASWYLSRTPEAVAYQAIKYQSRKVAGSKTGWAHFDVLRLAHPKDVSAGRNAIYRYIKAKAQGKLDETFDFTAAPPILRGAHVLNQVGIKAKEAKKLIKEFNLPREAVPTELLQDPEVWRALLEKMPLTALIRNLATLTRIEVLKPLSDDTQAVVGKLTDQAYIRQAKVHPLQMLAALMTYASGKSARGSNEWKPVPQIVAALNTGFDLAFDNVEPTGKRLMYGIDVSGSMSSGEICGVPGLTPAIGAAAMALIAARRETRTVFGSFGNRFEIDEVQPKWSLQQVIKYYSGRSFGSTDCTLPMLHALKEGWDVDAFCVVTDNETWANPTLHPFEALRRYRDQSGISAKMVVIGMTATEFSIADPKDAGMLDVAGFGTDTPSAVAEFIRG